VIAASRTGAPPDHQPDDKRDAGLPPASHRISFDTSHRFSQPEQVGARARDDVAGGRGEAHDQRKRQVKKEDADIGECGEAEHERRFQCALANTDQRFDHDHQHGRLDAVERSVDCRDAAAISVEQTQAEHHKGAGQHEQDAGGQAATHAVQYPADIGRKLRGLWSRQQHREIQRVQEAWLVDPFLLVDQDAMHHRNLACRPAEIDAADLQPDQKGLAEARPCSQSVVVHERRNSQAKVPFIK
jgi:hypothetical protein